jgi:uncharacterized protein YdhG (YjbR/CyaY superfamily)
LVKRIRKGSGSKDVDAYIAQRPIDVQGKLKDIRKAILEVAPGASETTSYFQMPGCYYPGYDYNGMFVWYGLQKSHISLLLRPPTIQHHRKELAGYTTTKAAVHFPIDSEVPAPLVKKLVKASLEVMKAKPPRKPIKTRA